MRPTLSSLLLPTNHIGHHLFIPSDISFNAMFADHFETSRPTVENADVGAAKIEEEEPTVEHARIEGVEEEEEEPTVKHADVGAEIEENEEEEDDGDDDEYKPMAKDEPPALCTKEDPLSLIADEKKISVDPISLNRPTKADEGHRHSIATTISSEFIAYALPPFEPVNSKSVRSSPSSLSSQRLGRTLMKILKNRRNQSPTSPLPITSLPHQQSAVASRVASQALNLHRLHRSKSCGEGMARLPSDDFDLWPSRIVDGHLQRGNEDKEDYSHSENGDQVFTYMDPKKPDPSDDEGFKCGAWCLFLPSFAKGKQVKARRDEEEENVVSRAVSLEKFECGSWSSSAILNDDFAIDENIHLYIDLPMELIRNSSINDAHSPVTAGFVFQSDRKGVMKKSTMKVAARKSHESSRHVRFSTSSPTSQPSSPSSCITPRLRRAREEFNAFLEAAQSVSHESSRHVRFSTSSPTSQPLSPSSCITPRLRRAREEFNAFLEAAQSA